MNHFKFLSSVPRHCAAHVLAFACATLLSACTYSTGSFDEPGLRGKLIDADTSQPVQGAVIYGYYATAEGSLGGGETIKEILRVFEVESNADGIFEIPAWKTTWSVTRGEPRQRFPSIAIYKNGYKLDLQNLAKIADWESQTTERQPMKMDANVMDWTARPSKLFPAKSERERYNALSNSNAAYAEIGACGWEQHVKLLTSQHVALKQWINRNVPPEKIGSDGRPKAGWFATEILLGGLYYQPTAVENIRTAFEKSKSNWKCANPDNIFKVTK